MVIWKKLSKIIYPPYLKLCHFVESPLCSPQEPETILQKTKIQNMKNLLLNCWPCYSERLPEQYRLLLLPLAASQKLRVSPCIWNIVHCRHRTQGIQAESDLKAFFLQSPSLGIRRVYETCQRRKVIYTLD